MPHLSVGVLAAIVNITTLFIVSLADRLVEQTVRNLTVTRLRTARRAPVLHDSDTWLPNLPRSLLKYHRHPFILLTILCSALLVFCELVTELGVHTRDSCGPYMRNGSVISKGDSTRNVTDVELAAASFYLQGLTFIDGPLTELRAGTPKLLSNASCVQCVNKSNEAILQQCTVTEIRPYEKGELYINISKTEGSYKTITREFVVVSDNRVVYAGPGDVTNNNFACASFVFHPNPDRVADVNSKSNPNNLQQLHQRQHLHPTQRQTRPSRRPQRRRLRRLHNSTDFNGTYSIKDDTRVNRNYRNNQLTMNSNNNNNNNNNIKMTSLSLTYLEYTNQNHCLALLNLSRTCWSSTPSTNSDPSCFPSSSSSPSSYVVEHTLDRVYAYNISCLTPEENGIRLSSFANNVQGYRTMKLENTMHPAKLQTTSGTPDRFPPPTPDDLYRAVLAMKIIDTNDDFGPYYDYFQCGTYSSKFLLPFLITLGIVVLIAIVSALVLRRLGDIPIPYSSTTWSSELGGAETLPVTNGNRFRNRNGNFIDDDIGDDDNAEFPSDYTGIGAGVRIVLNHDQFTTATSSSRRRTITRKRMRSYFNPPKEELVLESHGSTDIVYVHRAEDNIAAVNDDNECDNAQRPIDDDDDDTSVFSRIGAGLSSTTHLTFHSHNDDVLPSDFDLPVHQRQHQNTNQLLTNIRAPFAVFPFRRERPEQIPQTQTHSIGPPHPGEDNR